MKLIIDIDDKRFKDIQRIASIQVRRKSLTCEQIIANGTPLPKNHGRLIDEKSLRMEIIGHQYSINFCEEHNIDNSINLGMLNILMADAPTIIEADKENQNDNC